MSRQAKVFLVAREHVVALLRGEGRIRNLPMDAEIVGYSPCICETLGVLVLSASFPETPEGIPLPTAMAVLERRA